jgi:hypothetical protein
MISDEPWRAWRTVLDDDPAVLIELVAPIGNWRRLSAPLRSLDVPLEGGMTPWSPGGASPY